LLGQILAAPLIFVFVALVRNLLKWRQPRSGASAVKGALTFATLLVGIVAALFVYGAVYFSSTEVISGEARKKFVDASQRACVQRQRSISQGITEEQAQIFCTCFSASMADGTTYKQLGTELDARALADLRQRAEAVGNGCH
jgi:hypothetical protein